MQLVARSVAQPATQSVMRSVKHSVVRSVARSVIIALDRAVGRAVNHTLGHTARRAVGRTLSSAVGRAVDHAMDRAFGNVVGRVFGEAVGLAAGRVVGCAFGRVVGRAVGHAVHREVRRAVSHPFSRPRIRSPADCGIVHAVGRTVGHTVGGVVGTYDELSGLDFLSVLPSGLYLIRPFCCYRASDSIVRRAVSHPFSRPRIRSPADCGIVHAVGRTVGHAVGGVVGTFDELSGLDFLSVLPSGLYLIRPFSCHRASDSIGAKRPTLSESGMPLPCSHVGRRARRISFGRVVATAHKFASNHSSYAEGPKTAHFFPRNRWCRFVLPPRAHHGEKRNRAHISQPSPRM